MRVQNGASSTSSSILHLAPAVTQPRRRHPRAQQHQGHPSRQTGWITVTLTLKSNEQPVRFRMHRTRAATVIRAAVRLRVLAAAAKRRLAEQQDDVEAFAAGADTPVSRARSVLSLASASASQPLLGGGDDQQQLAEQLAAIRTLSDFLTERPLKPAYKRDVIAIWGLLTASYLSVLLLCVPLGIAAGLLSWGATPTFVLNFLALIPLALLLGDVTEDLAVRLGDTVGGLLNATFGNVVEMIISITALQQGLFGIVSTSLLGSILSNLLLVLGCCFFFGGLAHPPMQQYNAVANQATSSLLFLSCIGIMLPTAAVHLGGGHHISQAALLSMSRATAVVMLLVYASYLGFQLYTHHHLFAPESDSDEEPVLSLAAALALLAAITVVVAVCSDYLIASLEAFSVATGLSQAFLGMIVLPIAGNACEHITAVLVASRNKMDLALGVAVGSSIQIAVFAVPAAVVAGWIMGQDFTLMFDPFAVVVLTVSVVHANFATATAQSHWLNGVALITAYVLIAVVFLYK